MVQIKFIKVCVIVACLANAGRLVHCARASSQIKRYTIRRDMDTSIASNSYTVNSLLECSAKCTEDLGMSLYYTEDEKRCQCNNDVDASSEPDDPSKPEVVYGLYERLIKVSKIGEITKWTMIPVEQDCLAIYQSGFSDDGIYNIKPIGQKAVDTWCDMQNGGWTVVQRRSDGSEDFYRGWSDYVAGFGNRTGEYWLGLDNLHVLTTQLSEMYIYAEAFEGMEPLSGYAHFSTVYVYMRRSLTTDWSLGDTVAAPVPIHLKPITTTRSFQPSTEITTRVGKTVPSPAKEPGGTLIASL